MAKKSPFIFVLMPFKPEFDDIYQLGIKAACIEAGGHCERVDEQIFLDSILARIYDQIEKADLVVADMSGQSINVFYETGFAHALGKQVVLVTQNANDIPFDLKHYPHIIYKNSIPELKDQLCRKIKWLFANPPKGRSLRDTKAILEYKAKLEGEYKAKLEAEKARLKVSTNKLKAEQKALNERSKQIATLKLQLDRILTIRKSASENPGYEFYHWKRIFDSDYVYHLASCLAESFEEPREWKGEVESYGGKAVSQMIAWKKFLADKQRTPWFIRKTLRTIRDKRDRKLYGCIISGQMKNIQKNLDDITHDVTMIRSDGRSSTARGKSNKAPESDLSSTVAPKKRSNRKKTKN